MIQSVTFYCNILHPCQLFTSTPHGGGRNSLNILWLVQCRHTLQDDNILKIVTGYSSLIIQPALFHEKGTVGEELVWIPSYNLSFVHINTNIFLFKSVNNSLSSFNTLCNKTGNVSCVAYSRWLALIRMVRENSITINFVRSHNFDR